MTSQKASAWEPKRIRIEDIVGIESDQLVKNLTGVSPLTLRERLKKTETKTMISTAMMTALVVVQFFKFYMVFIKSHRVAFEVTADSEQFTAIKEDLKKMQLLVREGLDLCKIQWGKNKNERSGPQTMAKMSAIIKLYSSTLGKLSNLRAEVSGYMHSLDLQADLSVADFVLNLVSAMSQLYQTWYTLAWSVLTFLDIIADAAFMFLAFLNIDCFKHVVRSLNATRKNTNEVTRLQDELQDLFEQAERAYEKLSE